MNLHLNNELDWEIRFDEGLLFSLSLSCVLFDLVLLARSGALSATLLGERLLLSFFLLFNDFRSACVTLFRSALIARGNMSRELFHCPPFHPSPFTKSRQSGPLLF